MTHTSVRPWRENLPNCGVSKVPCQRDIVAPPGCGLLFLPSLSIIARLVGVVFRLLHDTRPCESYSAAAAIRFGGGGYVLGAYAAGFTVKQQRGRPLRSQCSVTLPPVTSPTSVSTAQHTLGSFPTAAARGHATPRSVASPRLVSTSISPPSDSRMLAAARARACKSPFALPPAVAASFFPTARR